MKIFKNIYFELFFTFFKVGLFTIGGGYAMLPMLRKEVVEKHSWASDEEMLDYFAIGQSTPGIIAVNTSTFIGYKKAGIIGAMFSTIGMVFPSWIIIISIARIFEEFRDNVYVQNAFLGIRVVVIVLILNAVIRMAKNSVKNFIQGLILMVSFLIVAFTPVSTIYVVIISGLLGILIQVLKGELRHD
jgi:chromate transporter